MTMGTSIDEMVEDLLYDPLEEGEILSITPVDRHEDCPEAINEANLDPWWEDGRLCSCELPFIPGFGPCHLSMLDPVRTTRLEMIATILHPADKVWGDG